jgi:polysaccharide deacetylase family protein (PEP-CTERM system associated)
MGSKSLFLFSVDVEDFPVIENGKEAWAGRVDYLLNKYLEFLNLYKMKATFFVLGEVAEKNPKIIEMILEQGHEVGCHGYSHIPLTKQDPKTFAQDIGKALTVFREAGAKNITGYRAPFLSMTAQTVWAYAVLKDHGFKYSSSVLPRYNPLFGWPGFGSKPKKMGELWELPVSLMPLLPVGVPAAAGLYFRVLPNKLIFKMMEGFASRGEPIFSYFHPYDIDFDSKSKTCSWLKNNPIGNYFIFYNRKSLLGRLENLMDGGFNIIPYREFVSGL